MPLLKEPFTRHAYVPSQPYQHEKAMGEDGTPLSVVWYPAEVFEMYRDAYAMLKALEHAGVRGWSGYNEALAHFNAESNSQ